VEKSGPDEFVFEHGPDFTRHIEQFDPDVSKVLVGYNPDSDKVLNRRQAGRLRELSGYLRA
jgi:5-dehydro-2-deoxygluconokinase